MSSSLFAGPLISAGPTVGAVPTTKLLNPAGNALLDGPNLFYQGEAILDTRYSPVNKDNLTPGSAKAFFSTPSIYSVNAVPSAIATANIAALANVVSGTAMTLASAAATGISTNVPIIPYGTNSVVTAAIGIDLGFQKGNCTSGSTSITVTDTTRFIVGEPLIIPNVGNSGGTSALITSVASITSSTVIVVANAPLATNASVPVCTGNNWGQIFNGPPFNNSASVAWSPYISAGPALLFDNTQGISRGISISGVSGGAGGTFTVSGYDIYLNPHSEIVTVAAGANTVNTKKTYKFIQTITPNFTDAHNYSVGTADLYGFAVRSDQFEFMAIFWNGALITSSTGYTVADTTNPATTATGDVRGTYATQSASDGTKRLVISQEISLADSVYTTPATPQFLYGITPV
jgi:hypothetical protein